VGGGVRGVEEMRFIDKRIILTFLFVLFFTGLASGESTIKPTWYKSIPGGIWTIQASNDYFVVGTQRNTIYAFSYSGKVLWKNENINGVPYYIAINPTGSLIAVGAIQFYNADWSESPKDHALLYLFTKDGKMLWSLDPEGVNKTQRITGNVLISEDSKYVLFGIWNEIPLGFDNHRVYMIDISGDVIWYRSVGDYITDIKATSGFVYIIVGTRSGAYLLNSEGKRIWDTTSSSSVEIYPVYKVGINELYNLVILGTKSSVYFLNLNDGKVLKTYSVSDQPTSIEVSSDGRYVVVGLYNGEILTFNRFGELLWTYSSSGNADDIAISSDSSIVYLYSNDGNVYAFDIKTGDLKWSYYTGEEGWSISITQDDSYLLAGGATTLFVFKPNVGYLTIYSTPSGASVYVDGKFIGKTPLENYELSSGEHSLIIQAEGYEDYSTSVFITPGETSSVNVNLKLKTGTLSVTSTPSDALVYVNGEYKGRTPLSLELPPGSYTIKLTKQNYLDYETTLTIQAGETKSISASLVPIGYLTVDSTPAGAEVYVDNTYIGVTPVESYKLAVGTYTLLIRKPGYFDYTQTVTISEGKTTIVNAKLILKTATLSVSSTPSNAEVYIGGIYKGQTPITVQLPPGTYTVEIRKEDYKPHTETITLQAGEERQINVQLEALFGFLNVYCNVQGAEVFLDGKKIGETPLKGYKLSTGEHKVEVKKEGYQIFTQTITIEPTKTHTINARLELIPTTSPIQTSAPTPSSSSSPITTPTSSSSTPLIPAETSKLLYIGGLAVLLILGIVVAKSRNKKPREDIKLTQDRVKDFPPELLDKYEPLEFLGEGGFAKVYKVKRKSDGKIIALKISRLDEKAKKFFLKEVNAWRLLDHPNIVKLYNAFDEPVPHLEIEFIEGVNLDGEVIRDLGNYPKPVDENTALKLIKGIAEGLKHAHSKQVYHRDLKPQNVLLKSDLTPKITDWGLAKVGAISTTATTTKGLTLLYAAPEQLDEEQYGHTDVRTDIYQLGLIFYELLTGKLPYTGTSPAMVMAKVINPDVKPKPPSHYKKELAKYDGIFEKLLAKRKENRYQSVEEFLNDLELLERLEEEKKRLEAEIAKTKTTMSLTTDSKELRKLQKQLIKQLNRNAILHAHLNDKAGLINALEELKALSKEHRNEIENAISQLEIMMRESVPISKSTLDELRVLLHKVEKEVEE
jgi:serine/threonine protein kinase/outer membrane protein assembly factor BamB